MPLLIYAGSRRCKLDNERRTSTRKAFGQEVVINHEKGLRFCRIKNISVGGAFLDIGWGALTRNVPIELSVKIPDLNHHEPLKLPAQVARVSTSGTAVSFGQLDAAARRALSEFVTR
jgi:hypothetical protein